MKTGVEICGERGLHFEDWPGSNIPAEEFEKRGITMIVACKSCASTMAFPSCMVHSNGYIYCEDCAEAFDDSVLVIFALFSDDNGSVKPNYFGMAATIDECKQFISDQLSDGYKYTPCEPVHESMTEANDYICDVDLDKLNLNTAMLDKNTLGGFVIQKMCFDVSDNELFKAFKYLLNWPFESEYEPKRYVDMPNLDGDGYWQDAHTGGIHRNDRGKHWRVGPFQRSEQCIIALAKLLPTVNTESDYNV